MPEKSFDRKLAALRADPSGCREFILWDAKDSDLGLGPGREALRASPEWPDASFPYRSGEDLAEKTRALILQGEIDAMLVSGAVGQNASGTGDLFGRSAVTPAFRFRGYSSLIDQKSDGGGRAEVRGIVTGPVVFGLGLTGEADADTHALDEYERFRYRIAAEKRDHVLELIASTTPGTGAGRGGSAESEASAETIANALKNRLLREYLESGRSVRPLMVNTPYFGPRLTEDMAEQLPGMPLGIVGGPPGTSYDAFQLVAESKKYGGRSAVLGRKIAHAEHQLAFVRLLRVVADGNASPTEAVHAYHGILQGLGIRPRRKLEEDCLSTDHLMRGEEDSRASVLVPDRFSSGRSEFRSASVAAGVTTGVAAGRPNSDPESTREYSVAAMPRLDPVAGTVHDAGSGPGTGTVNDEPDFETMSVQEKLDYNQRRRDQIFG